jgi:hypothetical protein
MANYLPQATGNWSTTTWITAFSNLTAFAGGNTPPTIIDDVYADGKTITVDINTAVNSIRTTTTPRTGGLAGGGFTITNGITLTANVLAGTTNCLVFSLVSPSTSTLVGNVTSSQVTAGAVGITNSNSGTLNIFGNILGGAANNSPAGGINSGAGIMNVVGNVIGGPGVNCHGITSSSTGTVNITGTVIASNSSSSSQGVTNTGVGSVNVVGNVFGAGAAGISNGSTGIITVTGQVSGGNTANAIGITNSSSGTVYLTGNALGGVGSSTFAILNNSTGSVYIYGTATGGANGVIGVVNNSTGLFYVTKVVGNAFGLGSVGIVAAAGASNSQNGRMYVEQVEFGPRGQTPISGPVYIIPSNRNTLTGVLTALGNTVTFYNSLSVSGLIPPTSSVRLGTVYNVGNSVGTMAVPSASAVQFGVPVDNTVGVAALTPQSVWGYSRLSATDIGSMGDRLRNAATTQSVGSQIASFNL